MTVADKVLFGGPILTMNPASPRVEAIAMALSEELGLRQGIRR